MYKYICEIFDSTVYDISQSTTKYIVALNTYCFLVATSPMYIGSLLYSCVVFWGYRYNFGFHINREHNSQLG